jgi:hypothetical protein
LIDDKHTDLKPGDMGELCGICWLIYLKEGMG